MNTNFENLFEQALALDEEGFLDEALKKYLQAIAAGSNNPACFYNVGLIYKYRNQWPESLRYNQKAYELDPENESARWNLAIAATALRQWDIARKAWQDNKIDLRGDTGPIEMDFGITPIRLNPDEDAEVVWARRIDPVRAKIENIPFPDSSCHYADIILHDGASNGSRMLNDREYPVFNALELFEQSDYLTFVIEMEFDSPKIHSLFLQRLAESGVEYEDWTDNYQILCNACSEGIPHSHDDNNEQQVEKRWQVRHDIAIATQNPAQSEELVIDAASYSGATVTEIFAAV